MIYRSFSAKFQVVSWRIATRQSSQHMVSLKEVIACWKITINGELRVRTFGPQTNQPTLQFQEPPQKQGIYQRIFQHTPGTYPRPSTICLWRNSFHLRVWGCLGYAPGVCWGSLRIYEGIVDLAVENYMLTFLENTCFCFLSKGLAPGTLNKQF